MLAAPRGYSTAFVRRVKAAQRVTQPAVRKLAQACLDTEAPITVVAARFGVTRATVYNWLVGATEPSAVHYKLILEATEALKKLK